MTLLSCAAVRRGLTAFHDRELPIERLIAIEAHLDGCPACAQQREAMATIGDVLRLGATALQSPAGDLAGLEPGVISRMKAEDAESLPARFDRTFEDMHLVWIGLSSAVATVLCSALALACLHFAAPERDDSLAGIIAAMTSSKASVVRQVPANTFDDVVQNSMVETMSEGEAALTLAAAVTREGRIIDPRVVMDEGDREQVDALMDAIARARFDTPRVGRHPSSVNIVWLFTHTTVRGKVSS